MHSNSQLRMDVFDRVRYIESSHQCVIGEQPNVDHHSFHRALLAVKQFLHVERDYVHNLDTALEQPQQYPFAFFLSETSFLTAA